MTNIRKRGTSGLGIMKNKCFFFFSGLGYYTIYIYIYISFCLKQKELSEL